MTKNSKIKKIEEKYNDENHDSILADLLTEEELATISAGKGNIIHEGGNDSIRIDGEINVIKTSSSINGGNGSDFIFVNPYP